MSSGHYHNKTVPDSEVSQRTAITRVRRDFPPAKNFACLDCPKPASEYDHPYGYKENWDKIEPVCRSCHLKREYRRGRANTGNRFRILIGPRMDKGYFFSRR